ncbi:flagellar hook-length control protein FliK [Pseudomonas sp. GG8]
MPLATHPLLQAAAVAKSQPAVASSAAKPAETGKEDTSSFARVFAKHAQPKPVVSNDTRTKAVHDKPDAGNGKQAVSDKSAASTSAVADSGKSLPADNVSGKADATGKDMPKDKTTDPALSDVAPVDPTLDPAALQALVVQPAAESVVPVAPAVEPQVVPVAVSAAVATQQSAVPVPVPVGTGTGAGFDPATDPLAGLPAVQMALEQSAKASGSVPVPTASTSAPSVAKASPAQADADPLQAIANNLTVITDQPSAGGAGTEGGDKAFKGLIEDGLSNVKAPASDTRVDDFANRLAALSQAVQPKAAEAASPLSLAQPLAMHQSGWSEGVVDRVMYMSSQNLKSADIQLEPAELGRLNIRVNMAPDQQTQVTFMSAHVGVRDALEAQMSKLRDSFAQQGLGQVDVNVSDQSRGWNGQGQDQQQASQGQRSGGARSGGTDPVNGLDDGSIHDVVQAASQPMQIIGSSEVDYYA